MKRPHANVPIFVPHAGCTHRCSFCDQRSIAGTQGIPSDEEIVHVLKSASKSLGPKARQAEIAFFGGSFTAIPRAEMLRLLTAAQPFLGEEGFAGIRISTRPDAVDDAVLRVLAEYGVTVVELGAQSMDDAVLTACGRGHTGAQVAEASRRVRRFGFSLGLQMMTGLPGETRESADFTMRELAALYPDTIRVYPALVLEGTALADLWRAGEYVPQTLEQAVAHCARLLETFTDAGIRVIRMGLHDSPAVRARLAGPYHPAFRELCESKVLLRKALLALEGHGPGEVVLRVSTGAASKMAGQRRSGLLELERRGLRAKIIEQPDIAYLDVAVTTIEKAGE